jgi:Xaa-Pro aminopeptidase
MATDPRRREIVLEAIRAAGLQAIICFSPTDVMLLTGYWPVMGSSLAMITQEGGAFVILPEDELELAEATSDAQLIPYQPATLERLTNSSEALIKPLRELAIKVPLGKGEIGTDVEDSMQTAPYHAGNRFRGTAAPLLKHAYPKASVVSADAILAQLRAVKTPIELSQIRRACTLAAVGFNQAPRTIDAGRREDEVAADINAAFARVANDGFERGQGYFFCMSGPNSAKAAGAYARTRRRVLETGDLVMIHANTVGDGFWTDITRTFVVGPASISQERMEYAITEARSAALKTIAPGVVASLVDSAARDVLAQHGFLSEFKHGVGHGVGFAAADPNALPRLHPKSPDVLQAGMTFNIEPSLYFDGVGGMRHCDVIACTDSGAEVLTQF